MSSITTARTWDTVPSPTRQKIIIPVVGGTPGSKENENLRGWILDGGHPGPRMLICAGVHGDEYEGPRALQQLSCTLRPKDVRGSLIIVPVVNEGAVAAGVRCHPGDGKDLARVFPGKLDGTISERVAYTFVQEFLRGADFFIDLHSASSHSRILPWAGYQMRTGKVQEIQRRMAIAFGLGMVWGTAELPGRTLTAAGQWAIPSIYVEMPGEGRCRSEDVAKNRQGVLQTLAAVGMIDGNFPKEPPDLFVESDAGGSGELDAHHQVASSGVFHPEMALGDKVVRGDLIGTVVDPWGESRCEVLAEISGRLVHLRTFPTVEAGDSVATVIETNVRCEVSE